MPDRSIPRFYLYGEAHRAADGRFVHVEALDDRSRPSEWTIRPHRHGDLAHVFHIAEGGGSMRAEGAELAFAAPCLILVPAGVVHGFRWVSESSGAVVTASTPYLAHLLDAHPELRPLFARVEVAALDAAESDAYARGATRLGRELAWRAPGHRAAAEAALLALLVRALRATHGHADRVEAAPRRDTALVARFRERVEARFRLREPVGVHAAALGVTEARLRAACAAAAGASPTAILDARACLEAQRALLYSNLSVAEVADSVGIADPAYFSRFFARHVGRSPRAFRAGASIDA